jgi:hypothetical protein
MYIFPCFSILYQNKNCNPGHECGAAAVLGRVIQIKIKWPAVFVAAVLAKQDLKSSLKIKQHKGIELKLLPNAKTGFDLTSHVLQSETDWANFRPIGDCFLWVVVFRLQK